MMAASARISRKRKCLSHHTLFEFAGSKTHIRAQEERRQLYQKQQRLRKKLDDCGIGASYYLRQKLRIRQCMADSGGSLTILPNGELGLCEHYSEDNFVGSLDGKASERSVIQSFREYWEPIEACKTCFYFSGELDLDIPPPLIRRKNSNRVEYNVHFSSYVGTFSIFPFIFRQKEKSHRPSDQ